MSEFCNAKERVEFDKDEGKSQLKYDHMLEVTDLKSRIAELEAERRWIPVSERLPEDGKLVWVCTIWNEQHSGFLIDGVWGGLFRDFREGEVTYWMSLPEPPESPNDTQTQTFVYGKESEE